MTALAAMEQAQPVAWIYQNANTNHEYLVWKRSPGGRNWRALYTAPPAPAIPAGWKLVPLAPTTTMKQAADAVALGDRSGEIVLSWGEYEKLYAAMLAAAPQPPKE